MRSFAPLSDLLRSRRGTASFPALLVLAIVAVPSPGFGQAPPVPSPASAPAVPSPGAGDALVPTTESIALWRQGREAAANRQWDVATTAWHSLLAQLQRASGESWETLDASTSSPGLAESARAALRALPEEAKAVARRQFDDAARQTAETALASGNVPALLALVRAFPLASCLPDIYRFLGKSASEVRRWERARAWYERCRAEFPATFAASPDLISGLAIACSRLHDAAALETIISSLEAAHDAGGETAPPLEVPGPAPGSKVLLLEFCRDLRALASRAEPPPGSWRPGDCAPAIGAIGPRVWSWSVSTGVDPLAERLRGRFPARPGAPLLFPYQPVIEGESLWVHGGSAIIRLGAPTGEIESSRTIPASTRFMNPGPDSPDSRAGCITVACTPSWIAAVVGLPLLQRGNFRNDGNQPRQAKLLWVDRTNDLTSTVDSAVEGPLAGSVPSSVPAIAADLPVLWRYVAPAPVNDREAPWSASLCSLDPSNGGTLLWESVSFRLPGANALALDRGPFERNGLMAVDGTRLIVCDQTAIIACVDALTGALLWAYPYALEMPVDRAAPERNVKPGDTWEANPILLSEGMALVTPLNAKNLLALDASTGRRVWWAPKETARYLLGARRGTVFISGKWACAYEVRSGKKRWPLDPVPEVRWVPGGRGLVAEDGLFIPTDEGLKVLDPDTGEVRREYVWRTGASAVTAVGNLAATASHLVVAGEQELFGFRTNARVIPPEALAGTLERIFRDLRGDSFAAREAAGEELIEIGAAAVPILERARTDADPEIVWRAHKLLDVIRDAQILVPVPGPPPPGGGAPVPTPPHR